MRTSSEDFEGWNVVCQSCEMSVVESAECSDDAHLVVVLALEWLDLVQ
jgi:hypothetical protein